MGVNFYYLEGNVMYRIALILETVMGDESSDSLEDFEMPA